jgi:hypothetical protein
MKRQAAHAEVNGGGIDGDEKNWSSQALQLPLPRWQGKRPVRCMAAEVCV